MHAVERNLYVGMKANMNFICKVTRFVNKSIHEPPSRQAARYRLLDYVDYTSENCGKSDP